MAKKKAPVKAPVKKATVTKKAPVAKGKKVVPETPKRGRPPGPQHVPDWIDVKESRPIARKNALEPIPGFSYVTLHAGPTGSVNLENLVSLIEKKDARLLKLIK